MNHMCFIDVFIFHTFIMLACSRYFLTHGIMGDTFYHIAQNIVIEVRYWYQENIVEFVLSCVDQIATKPTTISPVLKMAYRLYDAADLNLDILCHRSLDVYFICRRLLCSLWKVTEEKRGMGAIVILAVQQPIVGVKLDGDGTTLQRAGWSSWVKPCLVVVGAS